MVLDRSYQRVLPAETKFLLPGNFCLLQVLVKLPSDETPMSEDESDTLNEDESCNTHGREIFQELRSTNLLLGKLINEMRQTDCRVKALEEKATATTCASSSSSGASERKTKCVPLQIRVRIHLLIVRACNIFRFPSR